MYQVYFIIIINYHNHHLSSLGETYDNSSIIIISYDNIKRDYEVFKNRVVFEAIVLDEVIISSLLLILLLILLILGSYYS